MADTVQNGTEKKNAAEVLDTSALVATIRGEIDGQVATAHAYPRSLKQFMSRAESMVTYNEEIAEACFYTLPRGGKKLEGPGIRLAEIVAACYGNLRVTGFVLDEKKEEIVARGTCHDLETNVAYAADVTRRITDSKNTRFNRDMIVVTGNAAISIAMRNAIFRVVPKPFVDQLLDLAMMTARGKMETLTSRLDKALAFFGAKGIEEKRVFNALTKVTGRSVTCRADVTLDDMVELSGLKTALKDGEASADELFPRAIEIKQPVFEKKDEAAKPASAAKPAAAATTEPTQSSVPPSQMKEDENGRLIDVTPKQEPHGSTE